jgi:peptidyl-prolyl cis-trans isomerase D
MLEGLRALSRTWIGKIIGAFLLVGLAGFGISNVILDFGSNNVATVGTQAITTRDFQRAYTTELNSYARQFGRVPSAEEAQMLQIPVQVLFGLGADAALNQMGENMGIGVSDARLSRMLRDDPSFADVLGKFDPSSFTRVLRQAGYTEQEYLELQRGAARRQQIAQGLFLGAPVPAAAIELVNRYGGDTRTLDYFTLGSGTLMLDVAAPTEEDLAAYLTANQARYRTAPTRTVDLVALDIAALAATQDIGEADIAAEYERTRDQRIRPERRTIRQVPLTTPAQQGWFERGQAAGKSFDELVAEAGLAPTDLGTLAQSAISDAALAEAAFGLAAGDFAIIPGIGGQRAVVVTAIEAGGETPLAEVSEEIRAGLAQRAARDQYTDILDQIEELRAAFQPLQQIADRYSLPLVTLDVTADGSALADVSGIPADQQQRVATAIFAAQLDGLAPTVAISGNNNVWFDLKAVTDARDQTLEEVRDQVTTAWTEEQTDAAVQAEVDRVMEQLKSGTPFEDVAVGLNQFPVLSQPVSRSGEQTPPIDQRVAAAAFLGGEGFVGSALNSEGDHVIFRVVEIIPNTEDASADVGGFIGDQRQNTLYSDFRAGLRDSLGLNLNQQALNQILALDSTGN